MTTNTAARRLLLGLLLLGVGCCANAKDTVGWIETVRVYPGGIPVAAKVDTGARTSSLDCECINIFTRDGEDWVGFTIVGEDGKPVAFEKRVKRFATIKRHFGETQERLVVTLGICLGKVYREVEVNLVDRSGFNYPMLIGRNFLRGNFLVDAGKTRLSKPSCPDAPADK